MTKNTYNTSNNTNIIITEIQIYYIFIKQKTQVYKITLIKIVKYKNKLVTTLMPSNNVRFPLK